ncbi:glycosyl transferase [Synechococcus sp. PCC 7502]|uniref:glycosyltransferase n=1 Tax=Synechococcus sp. PCC 7502 TaxID=1173263 RepID=UPI00029FDB9D|nr:glycosyltransferase family 2 protein [Synechococcus sp. PCC 7502]AFY74621.1 glycosyl transferase [Synechococcus sp. PCC 7502]
MLLAIAILFILFAACVAIAIFTQRLENSIKSAPILEFDPEDLPVIYPSVSVIIPAYNEEINIRDCVEAILASDYPQPLQVVIANDQSTDQTQAIGQSLFKNNPQVQLINVPNRPTNITWRGKNWACEQGANLATGEYLLFIDADVRLEPQAIAAAISEAIKTKSDLLSCAPQIVCGCFAEWLVQPLIMSAIAIGFDFNAVNDPSDKTAFAAGMFMLFRHDTYTKIGGHTAVADQPVEDVELARLVKGRGLNLRFMLAITLVKVRMYQSFATLWEGWTKNYYMGSQSNLAGTLFSAFVFLLIFLVPWLGMIIGAYEMVAVPLKTGWEMAILLLSLVAIALQFSLRKTSADQFQQPLRYWWLGWLGGSIVAGIAITSIIKTETGWGWTWRGRSLALPRK